MSEKREVRLIDANALCEGLVNNHPVVIAAKCAPVITLNTLRDAIYEDAVAQGLWESADYNVLCGIEVWKRVGDLFDPDEAMRGQAMQIIRSEVDELDAASDDGEKYAEELADVIIAALSVAGKLGIDIDAAVRLKMEKNKKRPWKHGKEEQGNA